MNPRTGIIKSADFLMISENEPNVFLCHATPASTVSLAGIAADNRGGGCSGSKTRAFNKACGEAIERYCSSFFDIQRMKLASADELETGTYFTAASFYPFASEQYREDFPFDKACPGSRTRWVEGMLLSQNRLVYVPASCVYVPYWFDREAEPFTHMPISTGLACGPSAELCTEKGIAEVLERDCLMIVWHRKLSTPTIRVDALPNDRSDLAVLLEAAKPGSSWHFNLLTLDVHYPVISALLIDEGAIPKTSFGVSASKDPVDALVGAMEEALLGRLLINRSEELASGAFRLGRIPRSLREHMLYHAFDPSSQASLDFLINSPILLRLSEIVSRFTPTPALDALTAAGLHAIVVDVTTSDVRSLGLQVQRVLVPGAQPLDNDHLYPYLGGARLKSVPSKVRRFDVHQVWNSDPHPFP
jgi:ribosomal protein S12 methylthiotransferase accessory factor